MAEVIWLNRALDDVAAIGRHIGQFDSAAATRMQGRIQAAGNGLQTFPDRGRRVRGTLRVLVHVRPYLIYYRRKGELVRILFVRHGARRPL